jgi:hypothetical protein
MFEKGDKIICIDNTDFPTIVTIGKEYNVIQYHNYSNGSSEVYIKIDRYGVVAFSAKRFIPINEYRRFKILKLKKRICL